MKKMTYSLLHSPVGYVTVRGMGTITIGANVAESAWLGWMLETCSGSGAVLKGGSSNTTAWLTR